MTSRTSSTTSGILPTTAPKPFTSQFSRTVCRISNVDVVGVLRSNMRYNFFEFDQGQHKLVRHRCKCQATVLERDLYPMYSEYSQSLDCFVIFVKNAVTSKVEQYVFDMTTGGFKEVSRPELIFDSTKATLSSNVIALLISPTQDQIIIEKDPATGAIRKVQHKFGRLMQIEEFPVKTLMMQDKTEVEAEFDSDEQNIIDNTDNTEDFNDPVDDMYFDYFYSQPLFKIAYCSHSRQEFVYVHSEAFGSYVPFAFSFALGEFYTADCNHCPNINTVLEEHLDVKYAQYYKILKTFIVHVRNQHNGLMEQYVYDQSFSGFKQVNHPELVYDSSKDLLDSRVLFTVMSPLQTIIMRDSNGKLRKEQFFPAEGRYVRIMPMPVKTFRDQRMEMQTMEIQQQQLQVAKPLDSEKKIGSDATDNKQSDQAQSTKQESSKKKTSPVKDSNVVVATSQEAVKDNNNADSTRVSAGKQSFKKQEVPKADNPSNTFLGRHLHVPQKVSHDVAKDSTTVKISRSIDKTSEPNLAHSFDFVDVNRADLTELSPAAAVAKLSEKLRQSTVDTHYKKFQNETYDSELFSTARLDFLKKLTGTSDDELRK